VRAPRARDEQAAVDARTPGFATVVDLRGGAGARPADALGELLARAPGVQTRAIGGLGQFTGISVRGSSPAQVALFLDGVPLGDAFAGLSDVAAIPLDTLDRAVIHRGYVPIRYGGATLGGAIDLVGARGDGADAPVGWRVSGDAGLGSFGARQGRAGAGGPVAAGVALTLRAGWAGAAGDFPFYDTRGTPDPTDDRTTTRRSNGYDRVLAQARVDIDRGPWRAGVQQLVLHRDVEIPGVATAQASGASLESTAARTIAHIERRRFGRAGGGRLGWVVGVGGDVRRFADPEDRAGSPGAQDQRTRTADVYVSPRLRLPVWPGAFVGIVADHRSEWIAVDEQRSAAEGPGDATRSRFAFGAGFELEQFVFGTRWLIVPAIRVDAIASRFAPRDGEGELDDRGRDRSEVGASPRLGSRLRVVDGVELRASIGRYLRPPTLLELFGDRGFIIGAEGLRSERGTVVDGGVATRHELGPWAITTQLAGFATWTDDLIQFVAAGAVARPENVPGAQLRGLESGFTVDLARGAARVDASYTLLDTAQRSGDPERDGAPLPGRARHDLAVRAVGGPRLRPAGLPLHPRAIYGFDLLAATYLDPSARVELPARPLHAIGVELDVGGRLHVAFEVRNVLDLRALDVDTAVANTTSVPTPISDVLGFPLPGRSVWFTLALDLDVAQARAQGAAPAASPPPGGRP
jgi:iron complex outermembrane receptor protein